MCCVHVFGVCVPNHIPLAEKKKMYRTVYKIETKQIH